LGVAGWLARVLVSRRAAGDELVFHAAEAVLAYGTSLPHFGCPSGNGDCDAVAPVAVCGSPAY
jgi:hypothetical protein